MRRVQSSEFKDQSDGKKDGVRVELNGVRISPRKLNLIAKLARGRSLIQAQSLLKVSPQKGAKILFKLIKSGGAAAKERGFKEETLFLSRLLVNQGRTLKRSRPVARGSSHPILKRTGRVVLFLTEYGSES